LVSLFDYMVKKLEFHSNDFVHDAGVFITICLNDFFPGMCDTRLTSDTISLLINVEFYSIEEFNMLSYFFLQYFLSMFVGQICYGQTHCGAEMVYMV